MSLLEAFGWSPELRQQFAEHAAAGLLPGRVTIQQRGLLTVVTARGEVIAGLAGRLVHDAAPGALPVAGDWVGVSTRPGEAGATIHAVLPRRTAFVRAAAGPRVAEQVVVANADLAFLVAALTSDLNLRRLERYLTVAASSGADPVVVLTKADLCADVEGAVPAVEAVALDVPVHVVSAPARTGLEDLRARLTPGVTAALLGASGAGKSTLVNALCGREVLDTGPTREADERGRHTTTHRELVLLEGGGALLDTPGMRELGLWGEDAGVEESFADVGALAAACRFGDCAHDTEPGCAIRTALADGTLTHERYAAHLKLEREQADARRRADDRDALADARQFRKLVRREVSGKVRR